MTGPCTHLLAPIHRNAFTLQSLAQHPSDDSIAPNREFAISCGQQAASTFFAMHDSMTLHAHLSISTRHFLEFCRLVLGVGIDSPCETPAQYLPTYRSAYLARVRQELRNTMHHNLARPSPVSTHRGMK